MVYQSIDHKMRNTDLANYMHVGLYSHFGLSLPNKVDMTSIELVWN